MKKISVLVWMLAALLLVNSFAFAMRGDATGLNHRLISILWKIQHQYGRDVDITSGCRSWSHNHRIGGAHRSWHLHCQAADIKIESVNKYALAAYARSIPGRGGIGTYCRDSSIHIDVGPRREWDWGCRGQRHFAQGHFSYMHVGHGHHRYHRGPGHRHRHFHHHHGLSWRGHHRHHWHHGMHHRVHSLFEH